VTTNTSAARFTLSAFGDEIDDDLDVQLHVLRELSIGYLELRAAWGTNVLELTDGEVEDIVAVCRDHRVRVVCLGSPLGKSPLADPLATDLARLERLLRIADRTGTRRVRIFSFYPPADATSVDDHVERSADRLRHLAGAAERAGVVLLLENDVGLVGDTPERCARLLEAVGSAALRFVWDPANFVQVGIERPTDRGWPLLGGYLDHVQIKDALLASRSVCPAGEGDAQVGELLDRLRDGGYRGFLALEPHLERAGPASGFSGTAGMHRAAQALRRLMEAHGCVEAPPD
jgi:sugar phosphate isomerase/epimerase